MDRFSTRGTAVTLLFILALGACASPERPVPGNNPPPSESAIPADRLVATANELLAQERYREAARLFGQALEQAPGDPAARLGLAEAYLGSGVAKAALPAFAELAQLPETRAAAIRGQGISLLLLGQADKAQELLRQAVEVDPSSWRSWNALGRCHDLKARWNEAAHAYGMALQARPDAYAVHNNLGMSLMSQARYADAETKFLDALALRPEFDVARNNLRFAVAMQGRYGDAFSGAARQDLPQILNNVGYAAMLRGERDRAQAYFARAMEKSPHFFEIAYQNLQRAKGSSESAD